MPCLVRNTVFYMFFIYCVCSESCAELVNPRGLRVSAFAERVREPALPCMRVRGGSGLYLVRVRGEQTLQRSFSYCIL